MNHEMLQNHTTILAQGKWIHLPIQLFVGGRQTPPDTLGPFYLRELTLIPAWMINYIHYKVWDEITYPFPNFNDATVEVREWISNFIPRITGM